MSVSHDNAAQQPRTGTILETYTDLVLFFCVVVVFYGTPESVCYSSLFLTVKYLRNSPDCVTMAGTVHTQELHMQRLNSICRVCGDRSKRKYEKKKGSLCANYAEEIETYYGLAASEDSRLKFSQTMCRKCYQRLKRMKKSVNKETLEHSQADKECSKDIWCEYDPSSDVSTCSVCRHFEQQMKGGYSGNCFRVKNVKSGKNSATCSQSSVTATDPFEEIQSTSTPLKTRPISSTLMADSQTSPVKELRT